MSRINKRKQLVYISYPFESERYGMDGKKFQRVINTIFEAGYTPILCATYLIDFEVKLNVLVETMKVTIDKCDILCLCHQGSITNTMLKEVEIAKKLKKHVISYKSLLKGEKK